jgi:tetratricopeptide (TPR) repeat protein
MSSEASAGSNLLSELQRLSAADRPGDAAALAAEALAQGALPPAERAAVLLQHGRAEFELEHNAAAQHCFEQALDLSTEAGDAAGAGRAKLGLARLRTRAGLYSDSQHLVAQVLEAAQQGGWGRLAAEARLELGLIANRENRYRDALPDLRAAVECFAGSKANAPYRTAQNALAWAETGSGELAAGAARAGELFEELRAAGRDPGIQAQALNTLVFNACCHGDFELMLQRLQLMLELVGSAQPPARPLQVMVVHYNTAVCETQLGRFAAAKRSLNRAWGIARRESYPHLLPAILMLLSLAALHEDRPDMALEYAELARSNAREFASDEATLIGWYLALALLAAGQHARAAAEWAARGALEPSIENWQEAGWMRRALAHLTGPAYGGQPPLEGAARATAAEWEHELAELQATYPAPPVQAAAQA